MFYGVKVGYLSGLQSGGIHDISSFSFYDNFVAKGVTHRPVVYLNHDIFSVNVIEHFGSEAGRVIAICKIQIRIYQVSVYINPDIRFGTARGFFNLYSDLIC
jgi:hypothetical protein